MPKGKDVETDVLGMITNTEEEQAMIAIKKSMKNQTRFIYGAGVVIASGALIISAVDMFVNPFLDRNITAVLLPLSVAFLVSLVMDYRKRGQKYVNF